MLSDPECQPQKQMAARKSVAAILNFTRTRFEGRCQLAHHHRFLFEDVFMRIP
jgi:hypothetical protein